MRLPYSGTALHTALLGKATRTAERRAWAGDPLAREKTSLPASMALSLGNPKGEHVGAGFAVQVDDSHKMAISPLKQYVVDPHQGFYGTVV